MKRLRILARKGLDQLCDRVRELEEGESAQIKVVSEPEATISEKAQLRQRAKRVLTAFARQQGYGLYIDAAEVLVDGVRLVVRREAGTSGISPEADAL